MTDTISKTSEGKHLTLEELEAVVQRARLLGAHGDTPIKVEVSLDGIFDFAELPGSYVTRVHIPIPD